MKNSESNIEIILIFIRLVWFWLFGSLFYYGIRIFLFKRLDTNSFSFIGPIENLLPTGDIYISHLSLGSSFAVISVFYFFFHIFIRYFNKGENKHWEKSSLSQEFREQVNPRSVGALLS